MINMADYCNEVTDPPFMEWFRRCIEEEEQELDDTQLQNTTTVCRECQGTHKKREFDPVKKIKKGFNNFKTHEFDKRPNYYRKLAEAQSPKFLVFACSDSRVCPSNILGFRPGEAFMTRNIANLVPAFNKTMYLGVGATIEYAISVLESFWSLDTVRCGGIKALMSPHDDGNTSHDFINEWVNIGLPAKAKVKKEFGHLRDEQQCEKCEKEAVNLSLVNLLTYPYVRAGLANKALQLMGGHYDFVHGKLCLWGLNFGIEPPHRV